MESLQLFLNSGGFTSWLILILFVVLIVTTIDRIRFFYFQSSYDAQAALNKIKELISTRNYTEALQVCNAEENVPELDVVKSGLLAVENGREAMNSALGRSVLEISRKCEKRMPVIALIAGVATLLGLLGTITGLIKTFSAIAKVDAAEKAQLLGDGISEAMYSTASGLALGILSMVVYTWFSSKGDSIVSNSQDAGYRFITLIEAAERSKNFE